MSRIALAAVLASVYLAASGAASLHLVLRAHAVCLEHGELVHVEQGAHRVEAPGAASSRGQGGQGTRTFAEAPEAHLHEHCSLACHLPGAAVTPVRDAPLERDLPRTMGHLCARASDQPLSPLDRTDIAPKNSPPA